jgi:predicted NBD/HSP70 family sugar kinase
MGPELGIRPDAVVSTIPGFLDPDRDHVRFAGNIPELNGRAVASELQARTGIPITLERDAILSLRGEWRGGESVGCVLRDRGRRGVPPRR